MEKHRVKIKIGPTTNECHVFVGENEVKGVLKLEIVACAGDTHPKVKMTLLTELIDVDVMGENTEVVLVNLEEN
jgi:hypothetical protein